MPTLDEIKAKLALKKGIGIPNVTDIRHTPHNEEGTTLKDGDSKHNQGNTDNGMQVSPGYDSGNRTIESKDISESNTPISETTIHTEVLSGVQPECNNDTGDVQESSVNIIETKNRIDPDKLAKLESLVQAEIDKPEPEPEVNEDNLNINQVLAKEFNSSEEDIELFRKIYIQTGNAVLNLSIRELEEKIDYCRRSIKIIDALQQACIRVKGDKLKSETSEQKLKRLEEDKKYVPKKRPAMEADGQIKGLKESGREKLIKKFMKSGMTRAKAEALLDED